MIRTLVIPLPLLSEFNLTTKEELHTIIISHRMSCSLEDPIGSFLLAENIDVFVPFWVEIVNLSQTTGSMDCLKSAVLITLLKDLNSVVDIEHYKNF